MKRDLDLVRKLLLYFEEKLNDKMEECPQIDKYSNLEVRYHLLLMSEAGLLRCEKAVTKTGRVIKVYPFSLTWQGHEFLEASRNATLWNRAKRLVVKKTGGLSFEVLKSLLLQLAKEGVGIMAP